MAKKQPVRKSKNKDKLKKLNLEFRKAFGTAIISAVGLIVAFSWRDVIIDFFDNFLGMSSLQSNLVAAIIVTILAVVIILAVSRLVPSE